MDAVTLVRMSIVAAIAIAGLVLVLGGALGLLRFPDVYTRLHAAAASDGPGAAIFLVGLAVMAADVAMAVRLLLLAALIVALSPILTYLIANAAHSGGLAPIAGRYTAPRPGSSRHGPQS